MVSISCSCLLPAAFKLSPSYHMLVSASLQVGREIWTGGHCRDTVTFQGRVQQWDKAGGDFTERPHTQHSVPRLPLPGVFGTWPAHAETMQTSWMSGGGRGGSKVKNGRKKVRQGKEIRSMVWLREKGRKHHKNLMGREEESVIFNFHPPFCLSWDLTLPLYHLVLLQPHLQTSPTPCKSCTGFHFLLLLSQPSLQLMLCLNSWAWELLPRCSLQLILSPSRLVSGTP